MPVGSEFDNVWKKFMVLCRAKLMEKSKQCSLSVSAAEMSVHDAASVWFDPYEVCGQWLSGLEKKQPAAAREIKNRLQDIRLSPVPSKKPFPEVGILGIAAGGAAAGASVGYWALQLGTIGTVLSAAVPAIVLYPAMKAFQKSGKEKNEKEVIERYLEQVSLLKEEIEEEYSRLSR